ncbi:FliH/SctL family protein [Pseudothermotoga thermarum]|uniref:Flagellar export/assembly protein n=1 Tax=Pseudothermotoga thermarum DSM 5069 TaxID=688269 RepID=F7YU50_9THEM|nr:FliH/SctL family protein [Pseudothermotoga thermarum]AEH50146.1 flagellar export/assembly protein [Pseudothermotoga thermarum DSM 5069]
MIIKKRQLFIDAPYIISKSKEEKAKVEEEEKIDFEQFLAEAKKQAEKIILSAHEQAQRIIEEANAQSQRILQEAQIKAQQMQNQLKQKYQEALNIISKFEQNLNSALENISKDLSEVIALLVEKITYREIDKVNLEKKIAEILRKIVAMKSVKVTMSLEDFENHLQLVEQLEDSGVEVTRSSQLKPGEIIVETEVGIINGTREKTKQMVEQIIEEVLGVE